MSLTPRAPGPHQLLPPPRSRRQVIKRALSPTAAASPSKQTPHHQRSIESNANKTDDRIPEAPPVHKTHDIQLLQINETLSKTFDIVLPAHESCIGSSSNATRISCGSLSPISSELPFTRSKGGGGSLVPICSDDTEAGLVQFERSIHRYDGRGIVVLPKDDANVSIDKLLAQWADKINKAEQEFEEEELAFERAQRRLSSAPHRTSLRSLSPNASTRLLEKVKRVLGSSQNQNEMRLSPIKKRNYDHHHQL